MSIIIKKQRYEQSTKETQEGFVDLIVGQRQSLFTWTIAATALGQGHVLVGTKREQQAAEDALDADLRDRILDLMIALNELVDEAIYEAVEEAREAEKASNEAWKACLEVIEAGAKNDA